MVLTLARTEINGEGIDPDRAIDLGIAEGTNERIRASVIEGDDGVPGLPDAVDVKKKDRACSICPFHGRVVSYPKTRCIEFVASTCQL
mmetsp:Transcript_16594/g.26295  ORF Transcript_16594/g.26295 Transcript_16594/m.26295 type:complete len:88 (-) Transcript_16594:118-381(-)